MDRRSFLKTSAAATAGAAAALSTTAHAATGMKQPGPDGLIHGHEVEGMTYHKLGRTNFMASGLVFGCGAALAGGKAVRLLDRALEAGINFYDVGSNIYYRGSERHLAPFMKANRDQIWVSSKAPCKKLASHEYGQPLTAEEGKEIAEHWSKLLDESLNDLDTDYMDAYYQMMADDPAYVKCEELHEAFLAAKAAGKVGHYGISTHKRAGEVLDAMIETGWYDLAMVAITPSGWYEWDTKGIPADSPPLTELVGTFQRAREAGIGLVGMKCARFLSQQGTDPAVFDQHYSAEQLASGLDPFQRSYAYVLRRAMDVVNADMQNFEHLEANIVATREAPVVFA